MKEDNIMFANEKKYEWSWISRIAKSFLTAQLPLFISKDDGTIQISGGKELWNQELDFN